ncbi:hypothetical protein LINPERPRIM_LOCUS16703, partial [Linum perenne]
RIKSSTNKLKKAFFQTSNELPIRGYHRRRPDLCRVRWIGGLLLVGLSLRIPLLWRTQGWCDLWLFSHRRFPFKIESLPM